jgi:hypothetical protein
MAQPKTLTEAAKRQKEMLTKLDRKKKPEGWRTTQLRDGYHVDPDTGVTVDADGKTHTHQAVWAYKDTMLICQVCFEDLT